LLVEDLANQVRELVLQTCESYSIQILRGFVSKDYVYMLVEASPDVSPSNIMRYVKGRTSRNL
jgi:putative transposase